MAAILGVIPRLHPIKQILANRQLQSRYLAYLIERGTEFFKWDGINCGAASSSTPQEGDSREE